MSEKTETKEASAELPPAPDPKAENPEKSKKDTCAQSPTKEHDMFHNEGTDETYCRYCGKTD